MAYAYDAYNDDGEYSELQRYMGYMPQKDSDVYSRDIGQAPGAMGPVSTKRAATPQMAGRSMAAVNKNVGMGKNMLDQAGQAITNRQPAVDQTASAYVAPYQNENYTVPQSTVFEGLTGVPGGFEALESRILGKDKPGAPAPIDQGTRGNLFGFKEVDTIRSPEATGQAIASQNAARYTPGEEAMDKVLLRQNPEYKRNRQDVLNKEQDFIREGTGKLNAAEDQARALREGKYGASQTDLINRLRTENTSIEAPAKKVAEVENLRRDPYQTQDKFLETYIGAMARARAEIPQLNVLDTMPEQGWGVMDEAFRNTPFNMSDNKYYSVPTDVEYSQFINPSQYNEYITLQKLLGLTPDFQPGVVPTEQPGFTPFDANSQFNYDAYLADILAYIEAHTPKQPSQSSGPAIPVAPPEEGVPVEVKPSAENWPSNNETPGPEGEEPPAPVEGDRGDQDDSGLGTAIGRTIANGVRGATRGKIRF